MATSTIPPTDAQVDVPVDLTSEVWCEHMRESAATWHIFGKCPSCDISRHALVCDRCQKILTSGWPTRCGNCNCSRPGKKFFTRTFRL